MLPMLAAYRVRLPDATLSSLSGDIFFGDALSLVVHQQVSPPLAAKRKLTNYHV